MPSRIVLFALYALLAGSIAVPTAAADEDAEGTPAKVQLEDLLKTTLELTEGIEVVVSRVSLPPGTTLPRHWHPGEEFAYVLEGSVTLWQEGKEDTPATAGDVVVVPLEQVHTAITGEEGARLLVFRVHREGQPGRTLVE